MECPFCKEEIKDGAIKCKHCGSMLGQANTTIAPPPLPNGKKVSNEEQKKAEEMKTIISSSSSKVYAIKNIRQKYGYGLKEAKEIVENFEKNGTIIKSSGGCYIATAVYGSYEAPEVIVLRQFRDEVLAQSMLGKFFIKIYYILAPSISNWLKNTKYINNLVKKTLDKLIKIINKKS
jgi:uncharacterized Zn finger protein (UPF0148 family)